MKNKFEKIKYAAIKLASCEIFTGINHSECLKSIGLRYGRKAHFDSMDGFLTDTGRFVNRKEALEIATEANQIVKKHNPQDELDSADLELQKPLCGTCGGSGTIGLKCDSMVVNTRVPCPDCPPKAEGEFGCSICKDTGEIFCITDRDSRLSKSCPYCDKGSKEFVQKCQALRNKGVDKEQWEFATLLGEACSLIDSQSKTIKNCHLDYERLYDIFKEQQKQIKAKDVEITNLKKGIEEIKEIINNKSPEMPLFDEGTLVEVELKAYKKFAVLQDFMIDKLRAIIEGTK